MSAAPRAALEQRITALRAERDAARRLLAELQARQAEALDAVLVLDRAVRVLEEEVAGGA